MYKRISAIVIPTVIAAAILVFMLARVWDDLLTALQHAVPAFLVVAVAICLVSWWVRGLRYKSILKSLGTMVTTGFSTASIFVSQTANLIVPARLGDVVRVFVLKHEYNTSYKTGISSLVVERLFDILMVAFIGLAALPFILNVPDWVYILVIVPIVLVAVFFAVLLVAGRFRSQNKYVTLFLSMLEEVGNASLSPRSVVLLAVSSVVIWLLDIGVCVAVVAMFQQEIPFAVVALAIVVGNLVKAIPITPGGIGTYELSLSIIFQLAGVSPVNATLIAVIDHLVKNLVTVAGGVCSIYFFGDWVVAILRKAFNRELEGGEPA